MPNTRVTHVSLLVDREVNRNVCATATQLLVDRQQTRNVCATGVYLLVDCIAAYEFGGAWTLISEYTYTKETSAVEQDWSDTWELIDGFTIFVDYARSIGDTLNLDDIFGQVISVSIADSWVITTTVQRSTNVFASLSQNWVISHTFNSDAKNMHLSTIWPILSTWNNPGDVPANLANNWALSDNFVAFTLEQYWTDACSFVETWDLADKARSLSTQWNLSDTWSLTNLSDTWALISAFTLEPASPKWQDTWQLDSRFQGPHLDNFKDVWELTDIFTDAAAHGTWVEVWPLVSGWKASIKSVNWSDIMYRAIGLGTIENHLLFGLAAWISYTRDFVRSYSDIVNWHEQWRIEKPVEEITMPWALTSEYSNEILWGEFTDIITLSENWFGILCTDEFSDDFTTISAFSVLHDLTIPVTDNFDLLNDFAGYIDGQTWTSCIILPSAVLTLIGPSASIVLRNAEYGNTTTLEVTRAVGTSRGGTPYVYRENYWPEQMTYDYTVNALSDSQCDTVLAFVEQYAGCKISWIDHFNIKRFGFIATPTASVTRRSKRRSSLTLTLIEIPVEYHVWVDTLALQDTWLCL